LSPQAKGSAVIRRTGAEVAEPGLRAKLEEE